MGILQQRKFVMTVNNLFKPLSNEENKELDVVMNRTGFCVGSIVRYIGYETPCLKGHIGKVLFMPTHHNVYVQWISFSKDELAALSHEKAGVGITPHGDYGVFPGNIEICPVEERVKWGL